MPTIELYDRIRKLDEEFDEMADELARAFEALPEAQGTVLVDEALRTARQKP